MREIWDKYKALILVGCVALAAIFAASRVWADTVSDRSGILGPITSIGSGAFSGCGVGVYGSILNGSLDVPLVSPSSDGNAAGLSAECGFQMGAFYVGGFGDYGWVFGDIQTIGLDAQMSAGGKAGVIVGNQTLVYALLAKSWLDTAAGNIDGWQYGGGIQTRLPSAPLYLGLEYRAGRYDTASLFGVDADTNEVRATLTYKFGK